MPDNTEMTERTQEAIEIAKLLDKGLREDIETEKIMEQGIQKDFDDIETAIQEQKEKMEREKDEERNLEEIESDFRDIHTHAQEMMNGLQNLSANDKATATQHLMELEKKFEESRGGGRNSLKQDIHEIRKDLQRIEQEVTADEKETSDEMQRLESDIADLRIGMEAIKKWKEDIEKAAEMEQVLMEYANDQNVDQLKQILSREDEELHTAENMLEQIEQHESRIEDLLEQAEGLFEQGLSLELEEIKMLRQDIREDESLEKEVGNIADFIQQNKKLFQAGPTSEVIQHVATIEDALEDIEGHLISIEKHKENQVEKEKGFVNDVKNKLSSLRR